MTGKSCLPWWYNPSAEYNGCPYGRRLPGDITVPHDATPLEIVAVIYSVLPYAVVVFVVLEFLIKRGTRQLSIIVFTAFTTLANEFVVKKLLMQPRPGALGPAPGVLTDPAGEPVGSCNISCGMPSSHATMAVGFLVLTLLDGIFRVVPSAQSLRIQDKYEWSFLSITPLAPKLVMQHQEFVCFFCCWFIMLAPVPLARVRLYDHSADQVFVGGSLGLLYAMLWFKFTSWLSVRYSSSLGCQCWVFRHDYGPPDFSIEVRNAKGEWERHLGEVQIVATDGALRPGSEDNDSESESDKDFC